MIFNGILFILWFAVWMLLSWPPDAKNIISGVLVSLFVTFMTSDIMHVGSAKERRAITFLGRLACLGWFIYYIFVFLWECFKANIDVAYRVIHPDLPISPGTIKVKVALKSDIGLTFLANSITLTPGTTSVDVDKEQGYLYVHMLCVKEDRGRLKIVDKFENILKRIFE
ncbi:MAG: Na+/H+ antiporter subunit E [Candidatus Omnitrophica bacterium]|nr:Na+/H+ antiporter subunit E [Candidatus Omnitrophota bacterium]